MARYCAKHIVAGLSSEEAPDFTMMVEGLTDEEVEDVLASLEDFRAGRYEVLGPGLTDEEFLMAVHGW